MHDATAQRGDLAVDAVAFCLQCGNAALGLRVGFFGQLGNLVDNGGQPAFSGRGLGCQQ
jgi:hypothetical protein